MQFFGRLLSKMYGDAFVKITDLSHVLDQFNSLLVGKAIIQVEEGDLVSFTTTENVHAE